MKKFVSNEKGFGLLEAILAAGMLGGLAYMYATMQKNAAQGQNLFRFQMVRNEMRMSLVSYMQSQTASCSCSMKAFSFNPSSLPAEIDIGTDGLHVMGEVSPCGTPLRTVMKNGMQLENAKVKEMKVVVLGGTGDNFNAEMRVEVESSGKVANFTTRQIIIPMDIRTTTVGVNKQISECIGGADGGGAISFSPDEVGDTRAPTSGSWTLSKVPAEAKAVTVRWLIGKVSGSGKSDREDRKCTITNSSGVSYRIGYQSYGDGEAHWIGGTSIFRLGTTYPHSLGLSCSNPGGQGYLTVDGVIY